MQFAGPAWAVRWWRRPAPAPPSCPGRCVVRVSATTIALDAGAAAAQPGCRGHHAARRHARGRRATRVSQIWLWATLLAFAVTMLVFWVPIEVLVPFVIKNDLGGGAGRVRSGARRRRGRRDRSALMAIARLGLPRRRMACASAAFIVSGFATVALRGRRVGLADGGSIAAVSVPASPPGWWRGRRSMQCARAGEPAGPRVLARLDDLDLARRRCPTRWWRRSRTCWAPAAR